MSLEDDGRGLPNASRTSYWEDLVRKHPNAGELIQQNPDSPFEELWHHNTILHLIVLGFYSLDDPEEVVYILLNQGASPNVKNDKGETPLHLACRPSMRNPEIVKLLVKYGADPWIRTNEGKLVAELLADDNDRYSREIREVINGIDNTGD